MGVFFVDDDFCLLIYEWCGLMLVLLLLLWFFMCVVFFVVRFLFSVVSWYVEGMIVLVVSVIR